PAIPAASTVPRLGPSRTAFGPGDSGSASSPAPEPEEAAEEAASAPPSPGATSSASPSITGGSLRERGRASCRFRSGPRSSASGSEPDSGVSLLPFGSLMPGSGLLIFVIPTIKRIVAAERQDRPFQSAR